MHDLFSTFISSYGSAEVTEIGQNLTFSQLIFTDYSQRAVFLFLPCYVRTHLK